MANLYLSDVFRYVQQFGQKGHQIGRKIGDAIELITFGMISQDEELIKYLEVEDKLEGITTAKHKVEFSFYELDEAEKVKASLKRMKNEEVEAEIVEILKGSEDELLEKSELDILIQEGDKAFLPAKYDITKLFGFIECKKVGVEQTIKASFKKWVNKKEDFYKTDGFSFIIKPNNTKSINITVKDSSDDKGPQLEVKIVEKAITNGKEKNTSKTVKTLVSKDDCISFSIDLNGKFRVLFPDKLLSNVKKSLQTCSILRIEEISKKKIKRILIEDCLPGPQTPEKAKQASFVALDVRKRILGTFDKTGDSSRYNAILVIGEASHWEEKSRSMVRLCNDNVVIIPDNILIDFFKIFQSKFKDNYQSKITKKAYIKNEDVRACVQKLIKKYNGKILKEMDSDKYVKPAVEVKNGHPSLVMVEVK